MEGSWGLVGVRRLREVKLESQEPFSTVWRSSSLNAKPLFECLSFLSLLGTGKCRFRGLR